MAYDPTNVFARLLRGEIPCKKVYEDAFALAFHDITPQAPVHVLVIPKGPYASFDDFSAAASPEELTGFYRAVQAVAEALGVRENGYRVLSNVGRDGHQEVQHYHLHLFAGCDLGRMIKKGLAGET